MECQKLTLLSREADNRLAKINLKESLEAGDESRNLLNIALEDVLFSFTKIKEEEMLLADEYKEMLRKTREGLEGNFDPVDPEFISLKDELERLFKKKNLNEITKEQMEGKITSFRLQMHVQIQEDYQGPAYKRERVGEKFKMHMMEWSQFMQMPQ